MHASRTTLALTLAAAAILVAASPVDARPARFAGNVCRLLTAKQVTAVAGVSSRCTNAKPMPGPGAKIYTGNWAAKTPRLPGLQVTVSVYTDMGALRLAQQNLDQGLSGTPKRVAGIGSGAYVAVGAGAAGIRVAVGKDVIGVTLTPIGKSSRAVAEVETLAKEITARV